MTEDSSHSKDLWYLLLLCLTVRVICFVFSKNYDGDAIIRILMTKAWLDHPQYIWHGGMVTWVFAPLYYYLNGLALALYSNLQYTPRVVSLIFGTLAIVPFYKTVLLEIGRKQAVFASLAFCFFTLQVRYSCVATSEAASSFFLLLTVYLFFKYLHTRRLSHLFLTAVFVNLATMIRYEFLLLVPVLSIVLFMRHSSDSWKISSLLDISRKNGRHIVIFIASSILFMTSRFVGDYIYFGDPIYSIGVSKDDILLMFERMLQERGTFLHYAYNTMFWPGVSFLAYTPIVGLLVFLGLFNSIKNRTYLRYAIIGIAFWLVYTYMTTLGRSVGTMARFSMPLGILLLPFAGVWWNSFMERRTAIVRRTAYALVIFVTIAYFLFLAVFAQPGKGRLLDKISMISPVSRLEWYVEDILEWAGSNLNSGDHVLIDNYNYEHLQLTFYLPVTYENVKTQWEGLDDIVQYLHEYSPVFVVYNSNGILKHTFSEDIDIETYNQYGLSAELQFEIADYKIYRITGNSP
jgi:4-amino-4-deoxy-L-arabinose transferase-like glycosyltransferase